MLDRLRFFSDTGLSVTSTAIPPDCGRIQSSEDVLEPLQDNISRLAERADATDAHFALYYQPLLQGLAALLQTVPTQDGFRTLLASRLQEAEAALQRRWAYLLPPGAEPERLAQEADLWTYAVFTLGLLRGLGLELSRLQVELFASQGQPLGDWKPWLGSMAEQGAAWYRVCPINPAGYFDWTPLLTARLIPHDGQRWLWSNRAVFAVWLEALAGPVCPATLAPILTPVPHSKTPRL